MTRDQRAQRASRLNGLQILRVIAYLDEQIAHTMALGCTCGQSNQGPNGHATGCQGPLLTQSARTYLSRLRSKGLL
jgi:hypothetical protein